MLYGSGPISIEKLPATFLKSGRDGDYTFVESVFRDYISQLILLESLSDCF